ncbi:MAG: YraN family protein [Candidatus Gottesmanbacteria bacterium]|nr:YraN family protein [Candidatus Gottesmanbacteria bacterium]
MRQRFTFDPPAPNKNFHKKRLGKIGEDLACEYLLNHQYTIIERNFQKRYGELDIIVIKDKILIFVEVKTRIGRRFGLPEESVTPRKLREVIQTAHYYKLLHPELPERMRIDVIAIELETDETLKAFRHIENVTS